MNRKLQPGSLTWVRNYCFFYMYHTDETHMMILRYYFPDNHVITDIVDCQSTVDETIFDEL